jgi:Tfp pilus assembly protein PilF
MSAGAEQVLKSQVAARPDHPEPWLQLTALLESTGRLAEAEACYLQLLERLPQLAVARFNYACFLRRRGRLEEALGEHQRALDFDIAQPEEVLSNMGVIHTELRQDGEARGYLERALAINPAYLPAMFNLGLLHEEFGDREAALALFGRILEQDPGWHDALIRIAHAKRIDDPDDPVIRKLRRALRRTHIDALTRESLHFALGKTLDDCGRYDEAFGQYELGNRCSAGRLSPYDRQREEDRVARIVRMFTPEWLAGATAVSERPLVFVTGMFRSGSTLFEQVLAAHPRVTAGGEIEYFGRRLWQSGRAFPDFLEGMTPGDWQQLGRGYIEYLDRTFPAGALVTNKRPDAFALLGLLKAMFPNARFVNTVRDARDTCLSIWFQQFDGQLGYANDFGNIAHHYRQYRRLMEHWQGLFGASIHDAPYDEFVADPRPVAERLLAFLGLDWHEGCLEFQRTANRVRTASVGQVRESLYRKSSGRWRNYANRLGDLDRALAPY